MARKRRTIEEDHDHPSELWLVSYADMITVLFILMVILFAMSSLDNGKYEKMATSLQGVFNPNGDTVVEVVPGSGEAEVEAVSGEGTEANVGNGEKESVGAGTMTKEEWEEQLELDTLADELAMYLKENRLNNEVSVHSTTRGVEVVFQDMALFSPGSTTLSIHALKTLGGVVPFFEKTDRNLSIEGHTDNVPAGTFPFRDNFDLSNERALNVLYYLKESKVSVSRLSATGFGEHRPVADNSTKEGRSKNRRVNIVILRNN